MERNIKKLDLKNSFRMLGHFLRPFDAMWVLAIWRVFVSLPPYELWLCDALNKDLCCSFKKYLLEQTHIYASQGPLIRI